MLTRSANSPRRDCLQPCRTQQYQGFRNVVSSAEGMATELGAPWGQCLQCLSQHRPWGVGPSLGCPLQGVVVVLILNHKSLSEHSMAKTGRAVVPSHAFCHSVLFPLKVHSGLNSEFCLHNCSRGLGDASSRLRWHLAKQGLSQRFLLG